MILAQVRGAWSLGEILIAIIIIAACVGVDLVACRAFGVPIPEWVWAIAGIVLVATVAIVAIRFLLTL
jgi:hypothetical protein